MYKFSESTVAQFYGRQFYSISNQEGSVVAYSERVFEISEAVRFLGSDTCLIFEKAEILGGEILGGEIWGGEIRGGVIRGGEIWGGVIRGGEILGGEIRGGEIWGGEIWGGVIRGGVIRGGEIRGGVIRGGVHEHGIIEASLLQIQGTRHFCYARFNENNEIELGIGCEKHSFAWWIENYEKFGKSQNYSKEEILEYRQYIDLFISRYTPQLNTEKQ